MKRFGKRFSIKALRKNLYNRAEPKGKEPSTGDRQIKNGERKSSTFKNYSPFKIPSISLIVAAKTHIPQVTIKKVRASSNSKVSPPTF